MFNEVTGDILAQFQADGLCVTTNAQIKGGGLLVMGKGVAAQFADEYPWLPKVLGDTVQRYGSHVHVVSSVPGQDVKPYILTLPTKDHWARPSDMRLVEQSLVELRAKVDALGLKHVCLTRPGCGNGGLDWITQVKPLCTKLLDERFTVVQPVNCHPSYDGVEHINVYSQGRTGLGQWLSHFTRVPQGIQTEDGLFQSVEGYWYWLGTEPSPQRERLRALWGFAAKQLGRELRAAEWGSDPDFKRKINAANESKLLANSQMQRLLLANRLPLVHYYSMQGRVIVPDNGKWCWRHIEQLAYTWRQLLKGDA